MLNYLFCNKNNNKKKKLGEKKQATAARTSK
jgi:hypothetical protein